MAEPENNYWGLPIDIITKHYSEESGGVVRYMGDWAIQTKQGGWTEFPLAIFWQEIPPDPTFSNYFGIYYRYDLVLDKDKFPPGDLLITNGASAFAKPLRAIVADNGELVVSHYVHDFRRSRDGSVWIDGGRNYTRHGGALNGFKYVKVVGPNFEVYDTPDAESKE